MTLLMALAIVMFAAFASMAAGIVLVNVIARLFDWALERLS